MEKRAKIIKITFQNTHKSLKIEVWGGPGGSRGRSWSHFGPRAAQDSKKAEKHGPVTLPRLPKWRPKCTKNRAELFFLEHFRRLWLLGVQFHKKPENGCPLNPENRDYSWTVVQKQHFQVSRKSIQNELQK